MLWLGRITPLLTSRKILNITYQTPQETLLGTPETLPTAEPASPQISFTVAEADLPTFNMPVYKKVWIAAIYSGGKAVTAATIYWRMKKNGVSVATSSASVAANTFYTVNSFFRDVAVGDVLEIALWSSVTDSNWDYKAYQIWVSRLILMDKPRLLYPCNFTAVQSQPTLTLGNPLSSAYGYFVYHADHWFKDEELVSTINYPSLYPGNTYGLYRLSAGDITWANSSTVRTSSTYRPYYYLSKVPTQIVMRGVRTD